ncbi:lytic transglycosylase domain-containing protein [Roseibacterium beibuensis]|uniref:Transglycosylase SLT domain-containing protein n=2 Tax=[Roseibacterium] beibuensis TaxID=1193142 RepID=A0ABP9LEX9_9RHOB|nr:lytic transglycosylase domain-containing protein [Roseibacterium beibuensis]MCS6626550.1 lytic transglycosylase domain-containing protein [Roseibacterium beibuensis]
MVKLQQNAARSLFNRALIKRLAHVCALCMLAWALPVTGPTLAEPSAFAETRHGPAMDLCDRAARAAADETGVPLDILRSIALLETGRTIEGRFISWPWTLNAGGEGMWFDTRAAALHELQRRLASGRRNVDIGCFQLNHRWHAARFESAAAMIDPVGNARYAARFLLDLRTELGDWDAAIAAYHSRTPRHGQRYIARFHEIAADLPELAPDTRPAARPEGPTTPFDHVRRQPLVTLGRGSLASAQPLFARASALPLFGGQP